MRPFWIKQGLPVIRCGFAAMLLVAVVTQAGVTAGPIVGSVTLNANRTSVNVPAWVYDTGNGLPGCIITPVEAQTLGLGSWNATTGVFTPNGTVASMIDLGNKNHLAFYRFAGATVDAVDSRGNLCSTTIPIEVIIANHATMIANPANPAQMITVGDGNSAYQNANILNQRWINAMKAAAFGAGPNAVYRWPANPSALAPVISSNTAVALVDQATGVTQQVFHGVVNGSNGHSLGVQTTYNSTSNVTFLTQAQATALGLSTISQINLATQDPSALAAINLAQQNPLNQTVFDVVSLSSINMFGTTKPADRLTSDSGDALVLESGSSAFGILGTDFAGSLGERFSYFTGAGSGGNDVMFLSVPEPASIVPMVIGGLVLTCYGVARGHRRTVAADRQAACRCTPRTLRSSSR
jgi:hypothetical protein